MAASVLVDASFLVALLLGRDRNHAWSVTEAARHAPPWQACESVLSEAYFLLGRRGRPVLSELLGRGAVVVSFRFSQEQEAVLGLMRKYADVPMSLADACLVRMAEKNDATVVFTTDSDFRTYRKNGRQVIPLIIPD